MSLEENQEPRRMRGATRINDLEIKRGAGYRRKLIRQAKLRKARGVIQASLKKRQKKTDLNRAVKRRSLVNVIHAITVFNQVKDKFGLNDMQFNIIITAANAVYINKEDLTFFGDTEKAISNKCTKMVNMGYLTVVRNRNKLWSISAKGNDLYIDILKEFQKLTNFYTQKRKNKEKLYGKRVMKDWLFKPRIDTRNKINQKEINIDDLFTAKNGKKGD